METKNQNKTDKTKAPALMDRLGTYDFRFDGPPLWDCEHCGGKFNSGLPMTNGSICSPARQPACPVSGNVWRMLAMIPKQPR